LTVLTRIARSADHVIDLEVHSRLTTLLSVASLARNRIGFVNEIVFWRRAFYTHATYFDNHGPVYAFYDLLVTWFGIGSLNVHRFNEEYRRSIRNETLPPALALPLRFYTIGHACSDFGKERQLLPTEWRRVLQPLTNAGFAFVFLGGPGDDALAQTIIAEIGGGFSLCGRLSIGQSAKVIALSAGFIGIDSLLVHLARALGVPTVSVWGPTDPVTRLRPYGIAERAVFTKITCSPCIHVNETPPCRGRRECMVEAVNRLGESIATPLHPVEAFGDVPVDHVVGWNIPPGEPVKPVSVSYE